MEILFFFGNLVFFWKSCFSSGKRPKGAVRESEILSHVEKNYPKFSRCYCLYGLLLLIPLFLNLTVKALKEMVMKSVRIMVDGYPWFKLDDAQHERVCFWFLFLGF